MRMYWSLSNMIRLTFSVGNLRLCWSWFAPGDCHSSCIGLVRDLKCRCYSKLHVCKRFFVHVCLCVCVWLLLCCWLLFWCVTVTVKCVLQFHCYATPNGAYSLIWWRPLYGRRRRLSVCAHRQIRTILRFLPLLFTFAWNCGCGLFPLHCVRRGLFPLRCEWCCPLPHIYIYIG